MPRIQAGEALAPFRVLDLSRVRAGPTWVRMLADFGADEVLREAGLDGKRSADCAHRAWSSAPGSAPTMSAGPA